MKNLEYKFQSKNTAISFWLGDNGSTIIFAPGLPQYVTSYHPFVSTLLSLGYSLLIPKYQGTWESGGAFSLKNCVESVGDALELVSDGSAIELFGNTRIEIPKSKVILAGFSFGGLVALLTETVEIQKVLLMPFSNLKLHGERALEDEFNFLERAYPNVYRFNPKVLIQELKDINYPDTQKNMTVVVGLNDKSIVQEEIDWLNSKYNPKVITISASHSTNLTKEQFLEVL